MKDKPGFNDFMRRHKDIGDLMMDELRDMREIYPSRRDDELLMNLLIGQVLLRQKDKEKLKASRLTSVGG